MQTITVTDLYRQAQSLSERHVSLSGWIRTIRDSKAFGFISLNDGSCFKPVQIVLSAEHLGEDYKRIIKYPAGASIRVTGTVVLTPESQQPFEVAAMTVELIGDCQPDYPLQKKRHSQEFMRTMPHLRPRTNTFAAVFRVRSILAYAIHRFFQERGFVYVHTPIITNNDCEGAGEMFRVTTLDLDTPPKNAQGKADTGEDFFGRDAFLTVSGQVDVEPFCMALRNVYTFGPTFRAEKSNTTRHAAEFWMIEPEIAFAGLEEDMALAEDMFKAMIDEVFEKAPDEMAFFNQFVDTTLIARLQALRAAEFARVSYTEAIALLEKSGQSFQYGVHWGMDLQTEHERFLSQEIFHGPVFVTDYPKEIKAFYMRLNDDQRTVRAADLLVPGVGEIIGGSQREERLDVLLARMAECGLDPEDYRNYIDIRRYGGAPHAGYGLGFERALMYLTGISNIRDVIPYPRTTGSM